MLTIDKFFAKDNQLSFFLYTVEEIRRLTNSLGFEQIDIITRYPYKEVEYPTSRAYFMLRKPNA